MPEDLLKNFLIIDEASNSLLVRKDKQTINILFYTDRADVNECLLDPSGTEPSFGVWRLIKLMKDHEPAFAEFKITVLNRNKDHQHASKKLSKDLLKAYDQVWFFGIHQVNVEGPFTEERGGPQNELDDTEVEALSEWMKINEGNEGGGLLMTGDHANPDPRSPAGINPSVECPAGADHQAFLGLGRALGHRVPRAGQLRKWHGPPTACIVDSFNTQVRVGGTDINTIGLQADPVPQQLLLERFDSNWNPDFRGMPHPLFLKNKGGVIQWIQVFPDHIHEGQIVIPEGLDEDWPSPPEGRKAKPIVVAYGLDKRFASPCREFPVVVVYDGDPVNVGRIVADSTWHHYFNINLKAFFKDLSEDSVADHIGQYYANLACWLTPQKKRTAIAREILLWLVTHPLIREEIGSGLLSIGRAAVFLLYERATACEIYELLSVIIPDSLCANVGKFHFSRLNFEINALPSQELILGAILTQYDQAIAAFARPDLPTALYEKTFTELNREGLALALDIHAENLECLARDARINLETLLSK